MLRIEGINRSEFPLDFYLVKNFKGTSGLMLSGVDCPVTQTSFLGVCSKK